jgi:hypothetical protein
MTMATYTPSRRKLRGNTMVEEKERRVTPVGLRLPPSLKATLEEMARKERRSLASLVQIILEDYVAAKRAENGKPAKRK